MAVLKAVIILLLFGPTIISGKALEYFTPVSYQETNPCGTEWNYDTSAYSVAVQCSETKKPTPDPCIPSYAKKVEKEYMPKQNRLSPPTEPCSCEVCCNQNCEPYAKPYFKPQYKPSRQRCRRPLYDQWGDSLCQQSLCPRIKKKKEELDPCSKLLSNILQLPIVLVDGIIGQ
ncbi:unnamed protein product [Arctia plantaginis]|uniref:Uncharacterized protein n=1 Tax=Arctia plantaginis TaxID=874455 RepID=A0A8S0ZNQ1_ARCPL|nr:unnamed protein product [Arctia plantaginis]